MPGNESFEQSVREVLAHLHDLPYLQTHPLAQAVPAEPGARPAMAGRRLQRALLDAIEALGSGAAAGASRGGRIHRLLALRYVEALEVPAVRRELGLGKSEYYLQHGRGVAAVASLLRERLSSAAPDGRPTDGPDAGGARRGGRAVVDERAVAPADESAPPSGVLPTYLTSFVGREEEMAALRERLSRSRLVVLVGPAGAGKTRLAVEMAARSRDAYPDGVWFVDLAPLNSHEQIAAAIMATLGLPDRPDRSRTESIAAHLRDRRALLILDNCEHLVAGAAGVADALLRACPELRIMATSRESLGVAGETIRQLDPLRTPPASPGLTAAELLGYEGARLFVDRAELAASSFALTDASAAAVGEICRQLDGLPLALELAAARVRVLTVEQIAERLRERFRLLVGGPSAPTGATPDRVVATRRRHRTLRALVDWSHDLLSDVERVLLRRLAVFSGGWGLEAAEAICGVPPLAPEEVLDLMASLVDKSLVVMERHGAGRGTGSWRRCGSTRRRSCAWPTKPTRCDGGTRPGTSRWPSRPRPGRTSTGSVARSTATAGAGGSISSTTTSATR